MKNENLAVDPDGARPTQRDVLAAIDEAVKLEADGAPVDPEVINLLNQTLVGVDEPIKTDNYLFNWVGVDFMPTGGLVSLKAAPKVGKTFAATALSLAVLTGDYCGLRSNAGFNAKVVYVDTEQSRNDVRKIVARITHNGGDASRLRVHNVKNVETSKIIGIIEAEARLQAPALIVVDGIADLLVGLNYNDLGEAAAVIKQLHTIAETYNVTIVCVIHVNPGDEKATGWVGRILKQKCDIEISLSRVTGSDVRVLSAKGCTRGREFEEIPMTIELSPDGLGRPVFSTPEAVEAAKTDAARKRSYERLTKAGLQPPLIITRANLTTQLADGAKVSPGYAKNLITAAIKNGTLRVDGDNIIWDAPGDNSEALL